MEIWEGDSALLITFFKASPGAGKPTSHLDRIGFMVCLVIQLTVATIPTFLYGNWSILFITAVGTILSVSTASLKEWRREKYKCRKNSKHDYAVTRGNGHSHVFVIQSGSASPGGAGPGLFLDDLAGAVQKSDRRTKTLSVCFAFLWICFMITAAAIKDNTWFLLIVGLVGMTQNIWVAGRPRESAAHGIPVERIGHTYGRREKNKARPRVTNVLKEVELAYPGVGRAIRSEFLPDHALRPQEIQWWDNPPYPPANPPPNPPNPPPNPHPSQAVNQLVANQSPQNQPPINPPLVNPPPVTHSPATNQSTNQQPAN
ncbi:hypothetical protein W97_01976 [Coniosporium apollinis CBS 100218]|uniref:Uncharacterized protein n=1 Tax=Coniosporium apollinis (strain CBS 100218) TaxID=1168221 RepID=R7YM86_CONA1|nr:uncharacterized protein W97_01976 [Coniosporium apollinis CBS 100218]EON62751.1 hypothetical protein W97_01976 [Coniosporium apollinis CBS 100218]